MKRALVAGSGPKKAGVDTPPDWQEVRLDIDPAVNPDIVGDFCDMPQVDSSSFDIIWASHTLEHLYPHDVPRALSEFLRVLRPGGHLVILVPDLRAACKKIVEGEADRLLYQSEEGPVTPLDMIYGQAGCVERSGPPMAHKTGFTEETLTKALTLAGYDGIKVTARNLDIYAQAIKPNNNE